MHFFNDMLKMLYEKRNARAVSKRYSLNQRLENVLLRDVIESYSMMHRREAIHNV